MGGGCQLCCLAGQLTSNAHIARRTYLLQVITHVSVHCQELPVRRRRKGERRISLRSTGARRRRSFKSPPPPQPLRNTHLQALSSHTTFAKLLRTKSSLNCALVLLLASKEDLSEVRALALLITRSIKSSGSIDSSISVPTRTSSSSSFSNDMGFNRDDNESLRWALPPAESGDVERLLLKVGFPCGLCSMCCSREKI